MRPTQLLCDVPLVVKPSSETDLCPVDGDVGVGVDVDVDASPLVVDVEVVVVVVVVAKVTGGAAVAAASAIAVAAVVAAVPAVPAAAVGVVGRVLTVDPNPEGRTGRGGTRRLTEESGLERGEVGGDVVGERLGLAMLTGRGGTGTSVSTLLVLFATIGVSVFEDASVDVSLPSFVWVGADDDASLAAALGSSAVSFSFSLLLASPFVWRRSCLSVVPEVEASTGTGGSTATGASSPGLVFCSPEEEACLLLSEEVGVVGVGELPTTLPPPLPSALGGSGDCRIAGVVPLGVDERLPPPPPPTAFEAVVAFGEVEVEVPGAERVPFAEGEVVVASRVLTTGGGLRAETRFGTEAEEVAVGVDVEVEAEVGVVEVEVEEALGTMVARVAQLGVGGGFWRMEEREGVAEGPTGNGPRGAGLELKGWFGRGGGGLAKPRPLPPPPPEVVEDVEGVLLTLLILEVTKGFAPDEEDAAGGGGCCWSGRRGRRCRGGGGVGTRWVDGRRRLVRGKRTRRREERDSR